jgi:hypothetical protein
MLPEYDFAGGERGKYLSRYREGTNVVLLDPDIASAFPDAAAVNNTLRLIVNVARSQVAAPAASEPRTGPRKRGAAPRAKAPSRRR